MEIEVNSSLLGQLDSPGPADLAARALNDLRWALSSPVLCGVHPPHFERLALEAVDPRAVDATLAQKRRTPIGRYFEALIHAWLSTRRDVSKMMLNVPVMSGAATLGEMDLLFEIEKQCYHWELAVKFYLGVDDRLAPGNWYGPGGRDRLDLKLNKLNQRQLPLVQRPEAQTLLAENELCEPESYALIKGYLFHPFARWLRSEIVAPPAVNPGHARGWWIHHGEFSKVASRSAQWSVLSKPDWLAPVSDLPSVSAEALSGGLQAHFGESDRPLLLAAQDDKGRETERGFVVPDSWGPSPRV